MTSAAESVAASTARLGIGSGASFRANPRLTLISFADLSADERAGFGPLAGDASLYGALRDERGAVKVLDHDSAALLESLRDAGSVPDELGVDSAALVRLVLDGVLEIQTERGDFVSGSRALAVVCHASPPSAPTTKTARLSQRALQYAARLGVDDALRLSARLYFYGRLPVSPSRLARLPSQQSVERFLGIDGQGALARSMRRSWRAIVLEAPNDGWFLWSARRAAPSGAQPDRYKLYVSPMPEAVPDAFAAAARVGAEVGAQALKIGNDATSLLRPDKLVLYCADHDQVTWAAARLTAELDGCPGQGVPFTAELGDSNGLLSWGIDPPRPEHVLPWQERESWRLWVTNRLALAVVAARRDGGPLEPWQYALVRIQFDGIDPTTWTPSADLWDGA